MVRCREVQSTERFYKSVFPCGRVFIYKTLYLRWMWLTIHCKNWRRQVTWGCTGRRGRPELIGRSDGRIHLHIVIIILVIMVYVFGFIALYWAGFSAFYALWSCDPVTWRTEMTIHSTHENSEDISFPVYHCQATVRLVHFSVAMIQRPNLQCIVMLFFRNTSIH